MLWECTRGVIQMGGGIPGGLLVGSWEGAWGFVFRVSGLGLRGWALLDGLVVGEEDGADGEGVVGGLLAKVQEQLPRRRIHAWKRKGS